MTKSAVDVLCIGFGPAGLALSIALADRNARAASKSSDITADFVEAQSQFYWHPGMMLEGSRMQISFLKDLATLRDPTSDYTFLSYLHAHDRLASFINCSTFAPSRREYADYLTWAAQKVSRSPDTGVSVHYGEEVEVIQPITDNNGCSLVRVVSRCGSSYKERLARNLVLSSGGRAYMPADLAALRVPGRTDLIHSSEYLPRLEAFLQTMSSAKTAIETVEAARRCCSAIAPAELRPPTPPSSNASEVSEEHKVSRVAIIGSGQSAAELFLNLRSRLPSSAEVDLIIRHGCLRPSDDSSFSNEVFDPAHTDFVHALGATSELNQGRGARVGLGGAAEGALGRDTSPAPDGRQRVLREALSTNYAVVNPTTLDAIYEAMYAQRVEDDLAAAGRAPAAAGGARLHILPYREIQRACRTDGNRLCLSLCHTLHQETRAHVYDAIISATGYDRQSGRQMLSKGLSPLFEAGEAAVLGSQVERDYRLALPEQMSDGQPFKPRIWLQGSQEGTHGISDSLLSVVSVRAGEIVASIEKNGNLT